MNRDGRHALSAANSDMRALCRTAAHTSFNNSFGSRLPLIWRDLRLSDDALSRDDAARSKWRQNAPNRHEKSAADNVGRSGTGRGRPHQQNPFGWKRPVAELELRAGRATNIIRNSGAVRPECAGRPRNELSSTYWAFPPRRKRDNCVPCFRERPCRGGELVPPPLDHLYRSTQKGERSAPPAFPVAFARLNPTRWRPLDSRRLDAER